MKIDTAALSAKIAERKKFLEVVVPFVQELVRKRGTPKELHKRECGTHMSWTLKHFDGFSFEAQSGIHATGDGQSVTIWHANDKPLAQKLFEVEWSIDFSADACRVKFLLRGSWEDRILRLSKNWEQVAAALDARATEAERRKEEQERRRRGEAQLLETAKRLGLGP